MSKLVDERVVEMRFDNSNFERNTRQSMNTIAKLKSSMNFNAISDSLEKSAKSFSVWEIAGITAISNLTDRVVDFGVKVAKSLSVDNIAAGWQKFSEQTKNTGTIISQLSNSMSREAAEGVTSEYMKKLQYFSDMTSYSLTDMTSAISKFIGKGQDMDKSFKASVGIANWAATAGKNAQEAQIAFNALSKVADHVLSRQWTSIQLGTMDTLEFKNAVLEAAAAEGTLIKSSERLDGTIEYMTEKGHEVSAENFTEFFSDEWFNTDVLMNVLGKYGYAVEEVMALNEEMGMETATPFEALDAYKEKMQSVAEAAREQGDAETLANAETALFSVKALEAASEARTLEDAINAVKDAVSTGWLTAFQKIIGEYSNATEFFSDFADVLTKIFTAPTKLINSVLDKWNESNGRTDIFGKVLKDSDGNILQTQGAFWNLTDTISQFLSLISGAFKTTFKFTKSLNDITASIKTFSEKVLVSLENHANDITNIFRGFFSIFKLGIKILQGLKTAVQPIIDAVVGDSGTFIKFLGNIGALFSDWVEKTEIFNKVGSVFAKIFGTIIDTLKEIRIVTRIKEAFSGLFKELQVGGVILDAWKSVIAAFDSVLDVLLAAVRNIITFIGKYAIPALAGIIKYLAVFAGILAGVVIKGLTFLIDKIRDLFDYIRGSKPIQDAWKKFVDFLKSIPDRLKKLGPFFEKLGRAIVNFFKAIWNGIKTLGNGLASVFKLQTIGELFAKIGEKIAYGFNKIVEGIKSFVSADFSGTVKDGTKKLSPLQTFFKGLIDLFKGLWAILKALLPFIGRILSAIGALFTTIANQIEKTFTKDVSPGSGIQLDFGHIIGGGIVAIIGKTLYDIFYLMKSLTAGFYELFSGIGSYLRGKAFRQMAIAIKDIAISVLMLVGALLILTMIDTNKLIKAGIALGIMMGVLASCIIAIAMFTRTTTKYQNAFKITKNATFKDVLKSKMGGTRTTTGFMGVGSMILAFGIAILALSTALKIVDSIDEKKLVLDLTVILGLMAALALFIGKMNQIANKGKKHVGISGIKGLVGFALSILILTIPLKRLGEMPITTLVKGIAAVGIIGIAYGTMIRIMHGFKARGVSKIAVFAAAMLAMVEPVRLLGELDTIELLKGVTAITVMGLAYGLMTLMGSKMKISSAIAFIGAMAAFGFALNKIVELINSNSIKDMDGVGLAKFAGIFALLVGSILLIFAGFNKLQNGKQIKRKVVTFLLILAAIGGIVTGLSFVSKVLDTVNWTSVVIKMPTLLGVTLMTTLAITQIAKTLSTSKKYLKQLGIFAGVAAAVIALSYGMAVVAKAMDEVSIGSLFKLPVLVGVMIASTAGLLVLAKAFSITKKLKRSIVAFIAIFTMLEVLTYAMTIVAKSLNGVDFMSILGVIGMMAVMFGIVAGIVAVSSKFEKQIIKASKALLLLGAAFAVFGVAAILFGAGMAILGNNLQSMLAFAILVVGLSAAMLLLSSVAPSMLMVAAVFGILGASVLAIGAGFFLMTMALKELFPYLDDLAAKSDSISAVISAMIEGVLEGFANSLPTFAQKIAEAIDVLVQNLIAKLMGIFEFIKNLDIDSVMEVVDKLMELLFKIVLSALTKLEENIGPITDKVIGILIGFIDGLARRMPELMSSLVNLVLSLIDGLGQAIEDNAAKLRDTILGFCQHLWNAFLNFFGIHSPSKRTEEVGENIIAGIIKGIGNFTLKIIKSLVNLGLKMIKEIAKLPKQFLKLGGDILKGFLSGLKSVVSAVLGFFKDLWEGIKEFFGFGSAKQDYREVGKETMLKYKDGLEEGQIEINSTAKKVVTDVIDEMNKKSDIFNTLGMEIARDISFGITANANLISQAVKDACADVVDDLQYEYEDLDKEDVISKYLNKLLDLLNNEMDEHQFTITPVFNLDEVKNGTVAIAAMLGSVGNNAVYSASYSAERASSEINAARQAQQAATDSTTTNTSTIDQNGETYNVVFNVTGPDPKSIVDEVDKLFQHYVSKNKAF